MMLFTYRLLVTVLLGCLTYVRAHICNLNCGEGFSCAMRRSTCLYAPCPFLPTCVENGSTEDHQRHPSKHSHIGSVLSNAGVSLPQVRVGPGSRQGQCPLPMGLGPCINSCRSDGDCPTSQKCCNNGCGRTCKSIVNNVVEKPGTCPRRLNTIVTTCQQECDGDLDCPGVQKCCRTNCASVCSDPCYYWLAPNQRSNRKAIIWNLPLFCRL